MTDPLAHLYSETGKGYDGIDLDDVYRPTSFADLNLEDSQDEELTDADVAELALLVKERVTQDGSLPNHEAASLGLGDVRDVDGETELVLNAAGRQVIKHLLAEDFPWLAFGGHSDG